jgi:protein phosphatase
MILADTNQLEVAADSHAGMSGKNNEDRYGVSHYRLSTSNDTPAVLAVVADGIGGHRAGEIAAGLAVETISQAVGKSDARDPVKTLINAIIEAGELIREQAEGELSQKGMGATCACVWIIGERLYTATVGDSRIYLIRDQEIRQLSIDHTWVQEALDHGALTPEQARNHPNVHVIRRYLGSPQPVVPDVRLRLDLEEDDAQAERNQGTRLRHTDRLLLCSDGLTDLVKDEEILAALQTNPLEAAVQYLINLANHRGGHDNITIVALDTGKTAQGETRVLGSRVALLGCLGLLFLLLVALGAAAYVGWYFTRPFPPAALEMIQRIV